MKTALAQMHVVPMDLDKNLNSMLTMINEAKEKGIELIAFPELCVSGYLLSDQWLDRSFCHELMLANKEIAAHSQDITVVYGNIYEDLDIQERLDEPGFYPNKDGRTRLYNAAYAVKNGKPLSRLKESNLLPPGIQPKALLPNYRFFDDQRYFFSLNDIAHDMGVALADLCQPFIAENEKETTAIGLQVCEDLWCKDYRLNKSAANVSLELIKNGAQQLINISASPWTNQKHDARDRRIQFLKKEVASQGMQFVPFHYVNNVGAQNNGKNIISFDGGTSIYNSDGELVETLDCAFAEQLCFSDTAKVNKSKTIQRKPQNSISEKYQAIIAGLKHLPELLGWKDAPKFVVGLSGGVDSALVVTLLVKAFGAERVWAVNMPSQYNSDKTQNCAKQLADALGIKYLKVPIDALVEPQEKLFSDLDDSLDSPEWMRKLSDENIQAKVRGTSILSNLAGRYGRMFTNNGNKVEIALGYATLYGDVGGVIAPIGDLTKREVFDMVAYLNHSVFQHEVIPENLLPDNLFRFNEEDIAPSAELRDAQIDPMKFGYHCALLEQVTSFKKVSAETVLGWYLDGELESRLGIDLDLIKRWGIDEPKLFVEDLEWFYESIRKSVFKRIQSPPIILTSPSAYGFDIRESQLPALKTSTYKKLKAEVLALKHYPNK